MEVSEKEIHAKAEKITELLQEAIRTAEKDRALAENNYQMLKEQLEKITSDSREDGLTIEMSPDGELEKACNTALGLVFKSSERLDKVIKITSDIMINQLNNLTKEKIAKTFATAREINGPVDIEKFKRKSVIHELTNGEQYKEEDEQE